MLLYYCNFAQPTICYGFLPTVHFKLDANDHVALYTVHAYLVCGGLRRKVQHNRAEFRPHAKQELLLRCYGFSGAGITRAHHMMTMDYQAVDEVLVTHCVHRRNHNTVEGRVAGDDKFIGLSAHAKGVK